MIMRRQCIRSLRRLSSSSSSSSYNYVQVSPSLALAMARKHLSACAEAAEESDPRGPFSEKLLRLRDDIAALSDDEMSVMSATLRKKLGLPEPPPMGSMCVASMGQDWQDATAGEAPAEEKPAEKTSFSVKIDKFDSASKIKVIKEVRAATDLGLKEAKEFVEKVPAVLKSGLTKEEASQLIDKLKAVGATAVME